LDNLTKNSSKNLNPVQVKTCSDLARLSKDSLGAWIRSQGVPIKKAIKLTQERQVLAEKI
jgi:hypothetical protein